MHKDLLLLLIVCAMAGPVAFAQDPLPTTPPPATPTPEDGIAAVESGDPMAIYRVLRSSADTRLRMIGNRWYNLVKEQIWTDISGQFRVDARYVAHDSAQKRVKLRIASASGDREQWVPLDKLSLTSQQRVERIQGLLTVLPGEFTTANERIAARAAAADGAGRVAGEMDDASRLAAEMAVSDADRLRADGMSFGGGPTGAPGDMGSMPVAPIQSGGTMSAPPGAPPGAAPPGATPPMTAPPVNSVAAGSDLDGANVAPSPSRRPSETASFFTSEPPPPGSLTGDWQFSYEGFAANLQPIMTSGGPGYTWGDLIYLGEQVLEYNQIANRKLPVDEALAKRITESLAPLGEIRWQARLRGRPDPATGEVLFDFPSLPEPLKLYFVVDREQSTIDEWGAIDPSMPVEFIGRFVGFREANGPVIAVRLK